MSRIFDALQRSGTEQSGVEYPDMVSVATAVFEAPQGPQSVEVAESAPHVRSRSLFLCQTKTRMRPLNFRHGRMRTRVPAFPSLEVSVTPSSRLVFFTQPESLAAEKFRFLGVRLRQMRQSRPLKKVLVTSTIPEEGKSLVSVNLAGVLARRKERVLLIEGDMRRPTLAKQLGLGRFSWPSRMAARWP